MEEMENVYQVLSSIMSITGYLMVWPAVFLFKDVLAYTESKNESYRQPNVVLLYVLLVLSAVYPLLSSYSFISTDALPATAYQFVGFGLLFLAATWVFKATHDFVRFFKVKLNKAWMLLYLAGVIAANYYFTQGLSYDVSIAQDLLVASELAFALFLFAIAGFTKHFENAKIPLDGVVIRRSFKGSWLFVLAGLLIPLHGLTRGYIISQLPESSFALWRIAANVPLIIGGTVAALAMSDFKTRFIQFFVKINAMSLLKQDEIQRELRKRR